jgi:hypothetical protein
MRCPACGKNSLWDFTTHFMGDVGSCGHAYRLEEAVDELEGVTVLLDGRIDDLTGDCPRCKAVFDVGGRDCCR